jgi:hypothetical protein
MPLQTAAGRRCHYFGSLATGVVTQKVNWFWPEVSAGGTPTEAVETTALP